MELGAFSVSLSVKDLKKSKQFYQKIGFKQIAGKLEQNWLIMQNGSNTIGLFQGMFEGNLLTFNPGWDQKCKPLNQFTDIRDLRQYMIEQGVAVDYESVEGNSGPASFSVKDPDGNTLFLDQHV